MRKRLHPGMPVAVIANARGLIRDSEGGPPRFGGIVYTRSAEKVAAFIDTMNRRRTPLLFVQDVSGFMVGLRAERSGIIRAGADFVEAMSTATVPKLVVTLNHASGAGYYAMAGQGFDPDFILSLPTGRMGVMEGESAVMALFSRQLEELRKRGDVPDENLRTRMDEVREEYDRQLDARFAGARRVRGRGGAARGAARGAGPAVAGRAQQSGAASGRVPPSSRRGVSPVRVAGASGFWGDDLEAPVRQVEEGPIDYLVMDYLAEVTMSILHKQRARNPEAGYAGDFVSLMERIFPACLERGIRVVANAGGVNPGGCADRLALAARRAGVHGRVRLGVVTGDDLMPRLDDLLAAGHELRNMETGEPLATIRERVTGANVYLGAFPIARALGRGADVVVTGRCVDAALTLAPLLHEFGWREDDYDRLAAGWWRATSTSAAPSARAGTVRRNGGPSPTSTGSVFRSSRPSPPGRSW